MSNATIAVRHTLVIAACSLPSMGSAQVATKPLGKPEIEYREPFTTITGLRELRDGRVIVADAREKTLQLLDLVRGTATPVGRSGAGPGEWGNPSTLYALPGDSTLMSDFANNRYFIITPDGKPSLTASLTERGPEPSSGLVGIDAMGRTLLVADRRPKGPMDGSIGIADLMRSDRRSRRVDTVATLMQPAGERTAATMMGSGLMRMATNLPLAAQDLAALASDGRIAVVRAAPYRLEWIGTDGKREQGPVAVSSNIRITDAEKEAFTRSQIRPGAILVRGPSGGAPPPPSSGGGSGSAAKISSAEIRAMMNPDMTWPTLKPPFLSGAVRIDPSDRVWVLRTRAHDDSIPTYDVFDARGRVVERVALPKRTRLIGFGRGVVYLARTDDDDLVWLQRVRR